MRTSSTRPRPRRRRACLPLLALALLAPGSPAAIAVAGATPAVAVAGATPAIAVAGDTPAVAVAEPTGTAEADAVRIDAGGLSSSGAWSYDVNVSGGWSGHEIPQRPADLSRVTDPGPAQVYPSYRHGDSTYTFSYLNPAQPYRLRLHFNEPAHGVRVGGRLFDISVNGSVKRARYDILAATGGAHDTAVIEELTVRSDAAGTLRVGFRGIRGGAIVAGLELAAAGDLLAWPARSVTVPAPIDVGTRRAADGWSADAATGASGTGRSTGRRIDTTRAADAAPEGVYQHQREGASTYRIDGLTAWAAYTLRLHFAETRYRRVGERVFDVAVNGVTRLVDYDILARAGARDRAVVSELAVRADEAGEIRVDLSALNLRRPPTLAGIELRERHQLFTPGRTVKVLAVGDSITAGVGYPSTGGYRVPLFTAMAAKGWSFATVGPNVGPPTQPLQVVSPYTRSRWAGSGGWSMNDIIGTASKRNKTGAGIADWIRDGDPDVILLHIGTNDVMGDWDKEPTLRADYAALLDTIYTAKPDVRVLAATTLQFATNRDYPTIVALRRIVEAEAAERARRGQQLRVVPLQDALPNASYYADGVHPNRLGYETMAKVWLDALVAADES